MQDRDEYKWRGTITTMKRQVHGRGSAVCLSRSEAHRPLRTATWHPLKHKHRIMVLKVLAKINLNDSLGNMEPNPEDMWHPLRVKYSEEPYKTLLLDTNDYRLAEMDGRKPNQWTDTGENKLGNMLMQIRKELNDVK